MAQYYADYDDDDYGAVYASDQQPNNSIDPDDYYDLDLEPGAALPQFSASERLYGCLLPTTHQFADMMTTYVLTNLMFAFATQFLITSGRLQHLICIVCGNVVLHFTYGTDGLSRIWAVVIAAVLTFKVCCWWRVRRCGYVLGVVCMGMLLAGELLERDVRAWHRLRGSMLIVAMKMVSVAFDAEQTGRDARPGLVQLVGYLMSPATCVFGPWCRFSDYMAAFMVDTEWRFSFRWFRHIVTNAAAALVCLVASNCLIATIIPDDANRWLGAYRDAMTFRFSHYFVSYLGQTMLVTGSASPALLDGPLGGSWLLGVRTVEPLYVELPRSLVRVVVVWNRSMHFWLKSYVFRVIRPHGTFAAIIGTYAVSALLHGLNFQLSAVLLSLGLFTYVEHNVRSRLAAIFSACVSATACRDGCGHRYRWRHPCVLLFNALQSVLAVWHLAYLGLMFGGAADAVDEGSGEQMPEEVGYSYAHTLGRWASLHFVSHWWVAAVFVCFKLV